MLIRISFKESKNDIRGNNIKDMKHDKNTRKV